MDKKSLFEEKLSYYYLKSCKKIIVAPDVIVESEGFACGDKIKITLSAIDNVYFFSIISEGCSICTAVSNFLMDELYGKDENTIYSFIDKILNADYDGSGKWIEGAPLERKLCFITPLKLLQEAMVSFKPKCSFTKTTKLLACDACVSSFPINWEIEADNELSGKKSILDLFREVSKLDDDVEMTYQRLGKSVLLENEVNELNEIMNNMNKPKYKRIKKLRLPMLYYNNLIKYGKSVMSNDVIFLCKKQIISKDITMIEINKINEDIRKNNWKISKVKGARTSDYYEKELYRTHLDYDYVANNIKDGFLFLNYLINEKDFKFVAGGSVPFSLKVVDDYDGIETLTGHLHLEKIVQNGFQIVVDINLGGFPLGRTGIVKLNEVNVISVEDQFIITLCHIFKHEIVYMKDINDIYYMIKSKNIDFGKLFKLIELNGLELYYYVLIKYLRKNYDFSDDEVKNYDAFRNKVIFFFQGTKWPYSRKNHFWIKFYDLLARSINANGFVQGVKETYMHCMSKETQGIPTQKYCGVNMKKNSRTYLYPALIFNKEVSFEQIYDNVDFDEIVKDYIYRFKGNESNIIITSFGVFITQEKINERKNRVKITNEVIEVLTKMQLDVSCINQNYIMQARQDLWLY